MVKVLIAEPTTPAIRAPIIDWLKWFGSACENQSVNPGSTEYPKNPIPNPNIQIKKIANFLDILSASLF
jgi:hypothetical protein